MTANDEPLVNQLGEDHLGGTHPVVPDRRDDRGIEDRAVVEKPVTVAGPGAEAATFSEPADFHVEALVRREDLRDDAIVLEP